MKLRISVTLPSDVLAKIDHVAGSKVSRSTFIELVLRKYFRDLDRMSIHAGDLQRINVAADRLNSEAADTLQYQAPQK